MKQHIVQLTFVYDEDEFTEVTDKNSAIQQAIEEIGQSHVASMNFEYEKVELSMKTPTKQIIQRLEEMYSDVDRDGWTGWLNIQIGKVRSEREGPFYALQSIAEKALRDFPECMGTGEITDDETLDKIILSVSKPDEL